MPAPGSSKAPKFIGQNPTFFLEQIKTLGHLAGIEDHDELINWIVWYSSDEQRRRIQYIPEFDPESYGRTWAEAERLLKYLYRSTEEVPTIRRRDLEAFCKASAKRPRFTKKSQLDSYGSDFMAIAGPLQKERAFTKTEIEHLFVVGLPEKDQKYLMKTLPERYRYKGNPPCYYDVVDLLSARIDDRRSLMAHDWDSDESDDEEILERLKVTFAKDSKIADGPSSILKKSTKSTKGEDKEDFSKQLSDLRLTVDNLAKRTISTSEQRPRPCWTCDRYHEDPNIPAKCPEVLTLEKEGLVVRQQSGRISLPDGSPLPKVPYGQRGGVALILRNARRQRDTPPHLNASSTYQSSSTPASLQFGNSSPFQGNVYGISTTMVRPLDQEEEYEYEAFPQTRSQKGKEARVDPMSQKGRNKDQVEAARSNRDNVTEQIPTFTPQGFARPEPIPVANNPNVPAQSQPRFDPSPVQSQRQPAKRNVEIPPPPNPINRADGWKEGQGGRKNQDTEMKEVNKPHVPQFHFTSDIQKRVDFGKVFDRILDQQISVSISDLVGVSPQLQKMMTEKAKSRREYNQNALATYLTAETSIRAEFFGEGEEPTVPSNLVVEAGDRTQVEDFFIHHSNAVVASPTKFLAMVTGVFELKVKGLTFRAMVDTGSELNVATLHFHQRTRLPLDLEGLSWGLRGIHGSTESLSGICTDVDMWIGKYCFPHHVFINPHIRNDNWDIILGQPFLHWYAARIEYWPSGGMKICLWNDQDKSRRPHVAIDLLNPEDARNFNETRMKSHPTNKGPSPAAVNSSKIQEVRSDEYEDYEDFP